MKKLFFYTLIFLIPISVSSQGWILQNCGVDMSISKIYFVNNNTGWFATDGGYMAVTWGHFARTTNGGTNWNIIKNSDTAIASFYFINLSTGWILGGYGDDISNKDRLIYKTINSGLNWTIQLSDNTKYGLSDIFFIDQNYGWAVGGYSFGEIYRTTNSGSTWMYQTINNLLFLNSVYFINQQTGWIAGGNNGYILFTTNGGINWSIQDSTLSTTYKKIIFINNSTGWAIAYDKIAKTTNCGTNWMKINLGMNLDLTSICFRDTSNGFLVGNSGMSAYILRSNNGGINWSSQFNCNYFLYSIYFIDSLTGWAAGGLPSPYYTGAIFKTTTGGLSLVNKINNQIPQSITLFQNYPNPFNPITKIKFDIPAKSVGQTFLSVYDILGRVVAKLVNDRLESGTYEVNWNASNYSSGIYFYKLTVGDFSDTKKMILIK